MNTASTTAQNLREAAEESNRDAREGERDIGKAASDAAGNIESDLQALRDDFSRLAEQVGEIVAGKGNAAWARVKASMDGVVADAEGKGHEAADAVREVSENFAEALDESLKNRPYTTLAVVAGLGFLLGAIWRR
jgi:ElaB/YqjD/DUF883 family membrane-anchored ribosome-binding protein